MRVPLISARTAADEVFTPDGYQRMNPSRAYAIIPLWRGCRKGRAVFEAGADRPGPDIGHDVSLPDPANTVSACKRGSIEDGRGPDGAIALAGSPLAVFELGHEPIGCICRTVVEQ